MLPELIVRSEYEIVPLALFVMSPEEERRLPPVIEPLFVMLPAVRPESLIVPVALFVMEPETWQPVIEPLFVPPEKELPVIEPLFVTPERELPVIEPLFVMPLARREFLIVPVALFVMSPEAT